MPAPYAQLPARHRTPQILRFAVFHQRYTPVSAKRMQETLARSLNRT